MGDISTTAIDLTARAAAAAAANSADAAQIDATAALAMAAHAPVAGASYSITAGALTVHSTFGGAQMSKSDVGRYFAASPLYPNAIGVIANHVPGASIVGVGEYWLASDEIAYHMENGTYMDVGGPTAPSLILFYEV